MPIFRAVAAVGLPDLRGFPRRCAMARGSWATLLSLEFRQLHHACTVALTDAEARLRTDPAQLLKVAQ